MRLHRTTICLSLALLLAAAARAETIVLKNGRTIVANNVTDNGELVTYESDAGPVSIPKSLVERIDAGGIPAHGDEGSAGKALQPGEPSGIQIALPQLNVQDLFKDGAVNEPLLSDLGAQAGQGQPQLEKAFAAYLASAAFEVSHQRFAEASRWAEAAVQLEPMNRDALLIASDLDLARRQYRDALNHLLVAQNVDPNSWEVLMLLGDAYYFSEGPSRAVLYWKQAEAIHPNPRLEDRLRNAEHEEEIESQLQQAGSYHFALSWQGPASSNDFGRQVLELLEKDFQELQISLGFTPADVVSVVLYSEVQFQDVTHAPSWAGALNDGRIRVPVQGLNTISPDFSRVLKHELTHSFIYQMSEGRCPTWLNEGMAQLESGEQLGSFAPQLARLFSGAEETPLSQLEGSFQHFGTAQARAAYAESLAAVEWIRDQKGDYELPELLRAVGESPAEQALHTVVGVDYQELQTQLGYYLQEHYGHK